MAIITVSKFQQPNELNIPLAYSAPVSNSEVASVSEAQYLTQLIDEVQKDVLLNALGLATYNTLKLALLDINNPIYASYKKLVEGEEYDGKIWEGLQGNYSLLCYRTYEVFLSQTNQRLSGIGVVDVNPQGAALRSPMYKIANANQTFLKKFQDGYLVQPIIMDSFIDWYGQGDDIQVSLYRYLVDKKANFPDWTEDTFRAYTDEKNSFGI